MASASIILKNIDEKFCQCCICFQQYEDPRQLACLHRYCKKCLDQLIGRCDGKINCPLCQAEYKVPENGADGFKKDFYMNEILEFIQVQNSLEEDQSRKCVGCSKQDKSTAYCFKCRDFLCRNCHTYHMTSKILEEHRPHILTLKDVDSQNISIERLSSLKEAPRCQTHPENVSQLCCKTCANRPICVTCTYGEHRNHDIFDVISFANAERQKLKRQLDELNKCKEDFNEKSDKIEKVKQDSICDAETKLRYIQTKYQDAKEKVSKERKAIHEESACTETEINRKHNVNSLIRKQELEEKMKRIRNEYKTLDVKAKHETEAKLKVLKDNQSVKESNLQTREDQLDKIWEDSCKSLEAGKNDKLKHSNKISDQIRSTLKRCENITQTGSGVLSSNNNWTIAQNVDGIFSAMESLIRDMKKEFSGMNTLSHSLSTTLSFKGFVGRIGISEQLEKVFEIEGSRGEGWQVSGITCTKSGSIVLTGHVGGFQYHVTVVSQNGKIVKQCLLNASPGHVSYPESYCAALHQFQVVIVCDPNWIGVFDVRDGSIHERYMSDIVYWPDGQSMRSVSVDEERNDIIIGCGGTDDIYVLNDQLDHRRTVKVKGICFLTDVSVINGLLVACDSGGRRVHVVHMDGSLQYQISLPLSISKRPVCVRTDQSGFVYVLLTNVVPGTEGTYTIAQYSNDMRLLLRTKRIYPSVRCFTVAQLDATDKLLMASYTSWKVYQYGLSPGEEDDN